MISRRYDVAYDMTGKAGDPLHGVTLQMVLEHLVATYGWDGLARRIELRCFANDPSVKSSLTFLRRTPWARAKVEALYVNAVSAQRSRSTP